jgi:hypothetical protein
MQTELEEERKNVERTKLKSLRFEALLEVEQDIVKDLQQIVDQAKVDMEPKFEEPRAIEENERIHRGVNTQCFLQARHPVSYRWTTRVR